MHIIVISASILLSGLMANADVSLYFPDSDPQPLSVGFLGLDGEGRTSWQVEPGTPTGTFITEDRGDFTGECLVSTLVEGPNDVRLSFAVSSATVTVAVGASCTINDGNAVCVESITESGTSTTKTLTETVSPMLVQGGNTILGVSSKASAVPSRTNPDTGQTHGGTSAGHRVSSGIRASLAVALGAGSFVLQV